jgi:hypothetical protein
MKMTLRWMSPEVRQSYRRRYQAHLNVNAILTLGVAYGIHAAQMPLLVGYVLGFILGFNVAVAAAGLLLTDLSGPE